jgi:DNA ligase-1
MTAQNFIALSNRLTRGVSMRRRRSASSLWQHAIPRVIACVIQVRYERGVYLPDHDLWLDPWDAKRLAFVSHAHSDHIAPHQEIILSDRTSRLMQARMPGERHEHILPFRESTNVAGLNVTLFPAGHIFGSAQFFLQTDAGSLLYTGDFKLRAGQSAEPAEWRNAETLIMETTFGCRAIASRQLIR